MYFTPAIRCWKNLIMTLKSAWKVLEFDLEKCVWTLNLSLVWNIKNLLITFGRRVHRCCVQSLVQIGEIAWEEFEKVGLQHLANLRKKMKDRNGKWGWTMSGFGERVDIRFLNVQQSICELQATMHFPWLQRHLVVEIEDDDYEYFWQVWPIYQVWWVLGYVQAIIWNKKLVIRKTIWTLQVETCSGPKPTVLRVINSDNDNEYLLLFLQYLYFHCD